MWRSPRRWTTSSRMATSSSFVVALVAAMLLLELWPAPRLLADARISRIFRAIADDYRAVRVLKCPSALMTVWEAGVDRTQSPNISRPCTESRWRVGIYRGYLEDRSNASETTPHRRAPRHERIRTVDPERVDEAVARARARRKDLNIGWIVVDTSRATPELLALCNRGFDLQ